MSLITNCDLNMNLIIKNLWSNKKQIRISLFSINNNKPLFGDMSYHFTIIKEMLYISI